MSALFSAAWIRCDHRFSQRLAILSFWLVVAPGAVRQGMAEPPTPDNQRPDQAALERQFSRALTGATFIGHFTANDNPDGKELVEERYTLGDVKKLPSGKWLFEARIQYGDHDVTLPLTLPVAWARDTPVICVDNLPVPGLGNFTARVLIYDDHYAGFWRGKNHGGHLFGVIRRAQQQDSPKPSNSPTE